MLKRTVRIGLGLVALFILAVGVSLIDFYFWRADIIRRIEADPDRRIATTALGDIEYAVVGEGVPILVLHGAPAGYDQSLAGLRAAPEVTPNAMTIAVSRPGFLGTPLSSGATHEEQADLFAALLDELGVDRAIVVASSSGGRAGLQFALRHPDRTIGLVLFSPGVKTDTEERPDLGEAALLAGDFYMWMVAKLSPSMMFGDEYDSNDAFQAAYVKTFVESIVPLSARWAGNRNDLITSQNPAIDDWPLEAISAPTLIVHGDADALSDYEDSQYAAASIPNAQLVTVEGGSHFIYITKRREVSGHVTRFVQSLTTETGEPQ